MRTYEFVYLDERNDLADLATRLPHQSEFPCSSQIEVIGYDDSGMPTILDPNPQFQRKLPPLEFGYTRSNLKISDGLGRERRRLARPFPGPSRSGTGRLEATACPTSCRWMAGCATGATWATASSTPPRHAMPRPDRAGRPRRSVDRRRRRRSHRSAGTSRPPGRLLPARLPRGWLGSHAPSGATHTRPASTWKTPKSGWST